MDGYHLSVLFIYFHMKYLYDKVQIYALYTSVEKFLSSSKADYQPNVSILDANCITPFVRGCAAERCFFIRVLFGILFLFK